MPIYSYECPKCHIIEDKLMKLEERSEMIVQDCCLCGAKQVEFKNMVTAPSGFRLKGNGFYKKTSTFD